MKNIKLKEPPHFDFDKWVLLSKNDPEAFEKARTQAIEKFLATIADPERAKRLRALQWRVDQTHNKYSKRMGGLLTKFNKAKENANDVLMDSLVLEIRSLAVQSCVELSDMMWDSLERLNKIYYDYEGITRKSMVGHGTTPLRKLPTADVVTLIPSKKK